MVVIGIAIIVTGITIIVIVIAEIVPLQKVDMRLIYTIALLSTVRKLKNQPELNSNWQSLPGRHLASRRTQGLETPDAKGLGVLHSGAQGFCLRPQSVYTREEVLRG